MLHRNNGRNNNYNDILNSKSTNITRGNISDQGTQRDHGDDEHQEETRLWMLFVWTILLSIVLDYVTFNEHHKAIVPLITLERSNMGELAVEMEGVSWDRKMEHADQSDVKESPIIDQPSNPPETGSLPHIDENIPTKVEAKEQEAKEQEAQVAPVMPTDEKRFPELAGFKNSWEPRTSSDHPVFWHIAKSGGTTVKEILGNCFKYVLASDIGIKGHEQDKKPAVVTDQFGLQFVNVDTTTLQGIKKAKRMNYLMSGIADITSTPLIVDIEKIFTQDIKGRVFAIFRHPVERSISLFNYLQYADWEPTYNPELANMSLLEYARSPYMENNFLTRSLTNVFEGELNSGHLEIAMDFMRRKILVGLMHEMGASMTRFEKYFSWQFISNNPAEQEDCRETIIRTGMNKNKKQTEMPDENSEEYEVLAWENMFDIQLFNYAAQLFKEQEVLVQGIPDTVRLGENPPFPEKSPVLRGNR